jgi:hypothetical protein
MRNSIAHLAIGLVALLALPLPGEAQTKSTVPGHSFDISGVWARSIYGAGRWVRSS